MVVAQPTVCRNLQPVAVGRGICASQHYLRRGLYFRPPRRLYQLQTPRRGCNYGRLDTRGRATTRTNSSATRAASFDYFANRLIETMYVKWPNSTLQIQLEVLGDMSCLRKTSNFLTFYGQNCKLQTFSINRRTILRWLGSRVVSVLDSGGFKSQSRRCRVTVLGKLFTPNAPLFTKQQNW